ncbi:DoxX-like family protein [Pseudoalteromonas sp. MMG012]|uniref:DoxX-like family protein n=1 Tax=Pseudoalteromonas sp. MMG012 TaxID=2822686 RepID=UPI001B39E366|nr:DoxX-like family protein [Pseudoalteromonas sp. MMG012]MBQ4852529.1 DoxX-like family protein [Pseudoalteromonas sp. MMG012]
MSTLYIARFIISFSWIYHGIFPKLLHIAPLEHAMTASIGLSETTSYWITKSAGVSEVIFGLCVFIYFRVRWVIYLNILALTGLLMLVALLYPVVLIDAFNPVILSIWTTNINRVIVANVFK